MGGVCSLSPGKNKEKQEKNETSNLPDKTYWFSAVYHYPSPISATVC
jgi:hypothetical protein